MKVLATDPGERTGWVIGTIGPDGLTIDERGVDGVRDFAQKLESLVRQVDVVVYEVWRLYRHKAKQLTGNDMQPSQVVGMIRYEAWKQQKKVVSQGAQIKSTALKTMPQGMQDQMAESSEQHDQDAVMHAWFYYWKNNAEPEES